MELIRAELRLWVETGFLDFVTSVILMAGGAFIVACLV